MRNIETCFFPAVLWFALHCIIKKEEKKSLSASVGMHTTDALYFTCIHGTLCIIWPDNPY